MITFFGPTNQKSPIGSDNWITGGRNNHLRRPVPKGYGRGLLNCLGLIRNPGGTGPGREINVLGAAYYVMTRKVKETELAAQSERWTINEWRLWKTIGCSKSR
jgi:hypothetical protein